MQLPFPELMPESDWSLPDEFPDLVGRGAKFIGIDTETRDPKLSERGPGFIRGDAFIAGYSVYADGFNKYYPVRHALGTNLPPNLVADWIGQQMRSDVEKRVANGLYDLEAMWYEGIRDVRGKIYDIQVAEPLLDEETAEGYSLEVLSRKYLGEGKEEEVLRQAAQLYSHGGKRRGKGNIPFNPKKDLWLMDPKYAGPYAEGDAIKTSLVLEKQLPIIDRDGIRPIFELESSLIPIILRMRIQGIAVDVEAAEKLARDLTREIDELSMSIKQEVGFDVNIDSPVDLPKAYEVWNKKHWDRRVEFAYTAIGNKSFNKEWLSKQDDPLSRTISSKRRLMTMRDDFVLGDILGEQVNGRVHAQFHQLRQDDKGTRSGRFSCVAGKTKLRTSRGSFTIEDYEPQAGDMIRTHTGCWRPILRKIYKGLDHMYAVKLLGGQEITCTGKHSLLTPDGWRCLADLRMGSEVLSYEHTFESCEVSRDHSAGFPQPRDGQEWFPAPQLKSISTGWNSSGYQNWPRETLPKIGIIAEIIYVGQMGVWDIEVEGDHSYLAEGFLNHNSTNPNLQQTPKRDKVWGPKIRSLFVADAGKRMIKADVSQQEPRLLVHYASLCGMPGAAEAVAAFRANPLTDYHILTMEICNRISGRNFVRDDLKSLNLGKMYGMGLKKLCKQLNVSESLGKLIVGDYDSAIPFVKALSNKCMSMAQDRGWISTLLGRLRRFNLWEPISERREEAQYITRGLPRNVAERTWPGRRLQRWGTHKALNALIQGSAADQIKKAMAILFYQFGIVPALQVHDELVGSVSDVEEARTYKRVIETAVVLQIPVICDAKLGPSWGNAGETVELLAA